MNKRRWFASALLAGLLGYGVMVVQPIAPTWANFEDSPKNVIDEVWQIVYSNYVDDTFNKHDWLATRKEFLSKDYSTNEEAYKAVRTMLKELNDPYTRFMDPKQYASTQVELSGELTGVGISVDQDKDTKELVVVSPVPDTPAFKAGLQAKDIIQAIDGIPTKGIGREDSVARIRGKVGTAVTLTIRRPDKTFEVKLTREVIPIKVVRSSVKTEKGKSIGYIQFTEFTGHSAEEMSKALKDLQTKKVDGYVLDLRGNPGGSLQASIAIASMFLNKQTLVVTTANRDGIVQEDRASGETITDKPVVVLVNKGSASASEILSGALQDNHRAVLVGTTTFGKGLVQSMQPLSDRSGLAVTIAHYKTPAGIDIHKKGIKPDYYVELPGVDDAAADCVANAKGAKGSKAKPANKPFTGSVAGMVTLPKKPLTKAVLQQCGTVKKPVITFTATDIGTSKDAQYVRATDVLIQRIAQGSNKPSTQVSSVAP